MYATEKINDLDYMALTTNRNGGKVVQVSTVKGSMDYVDRLRIQFAENDKTNLQRAIWPLSNPMPNQTDGSKRTWELSVESADLVTYLRALDEKNCAMAKERCKEWFKKEMTDVELRGMYTPIIKENGNVKIKVQCSDKPTRIMVVDADKGLTVAPTVGSDKDLVKGARCLLVANTPGLWFMRFQWGMSFTATDILVWKPRVMTGINAFTFHPSTTLKTHDVQDPVGDIEDMAVESE